MYFPLLSFLKEVCTGQLGAYSGKVKNVEKFNISDIYPITAT